MKAVVGGGSSAFTLIEVIAALAIVSIAILSLLQFHLATVRMAGTTRTTAMAILVAQEKTAETSCNGWPALGVKSGVADMDGSQFNWRTEVTDPGSLASCGIGHNAVRQVCVNVTWRDGASPRAVQMTTYLADHRIP
ncbi:MAG: type II secretion system minor pseudopilin GspI [Sedimentisphaerales bacterium]|nr:type II secretion system minor pseudopilin GspI [Sedimentisphaerales bacterium]